MASEPTFYEVLTAAISDIADNGFDTPERIKYWQDALRRAAERSMASAAQMEQQLREAMAAIYKRLVENGGAAKFHPGISRFTIDRLRPELRLALDRRIMASADLIKLNRQQSIDKTLQRFSGWATSIPPGGAKTDKREEKAHIRKALASQSYEYRRVAIDQGHKLSANINETIARGGNAIALIWHSHWRQAGYDYREDHKERDGEVYLLKGSWALEQGLIRPGPAGYYEDIDGVAVAPFCRCYAQYVYALRGIPENMLTAKGAEALALARTKIAEMV